MGMGAFRKLVKREVARATGSKVYSRIHCKEVSLAAASTTYVSLLSCDDDPNYDTTSDGTNIAEVHPNSRLLGMQLHMGLYVASNPISNGPMEFILYRDPDAALSTAATMAELQGADVTTNRLTLRKNTILAGHQFITTNREYQNQNLRVRRKTLNRIRVMHDNDVIKMAFTNPDPDTVCMLYLRGRILSKTP